MGLKLAAALVVATLVTVSDTGKAVRTQAVHEARDTSVTVSGTGTSYLRAHQLAGGGFAEPGGAPSVQLTAWAVLGLRSAGSSPRAGALAYLQAHDDELASATDLELAAMAETVLGAPPKQLLARIERLERRNGAIGPNVNSTIWGILALRQAGRRVPKPAVRYLLRRQGQSGGWPWYPGGQPDSNDTAAAVEALRAAGVRGKPIRRGLAYLHGLQRRDGGFELTRGRASDAQSTAWAIQAFLAAAKAPPRGALAYLRRMRTSNGSFRYSARYVTTPVWVTAQVLPALARRPFPL